jgi:hypothetical protein
MGGFMGIGFVLDEEGNIITFDDPEKNIQQSLNSIKQAANYLMRDNKALRATLNKYNKDVEIKAKDDEIRSIQQRSISVLSPVEYERDKEFRERHYQICKNGSHFIYDLQGTGIGTVVKIRCPVCGVEEDITDTSCW